MNHKLLIGALATTLSFASAAADYYVVAPLPGKTVNASAISVSLAQASLPGAEVGLAYAYDFKSNLQVTGDPGYTGYGLKWSLSSGVLPAGLSLNADTGMLTGQPTTEGTSNFTLRATYKSKQASQNYAIAIASAGDILLANGVRTWLDGSYAASCSEYRNSTGAGRTYTGNTGDGIYRISVGGVATDVYCDMTTDGGGWTMWYTTANYYHLATAATNATAFGTDGYSRNLRALPFKEVLYVNHATGGKDWFTRDAGTTLKVADYVGANNVISTNGSALGLWTGKGGASTAYKYQLIMADNTWMQVGLMMSGYSSCWKVPNAWCNDTTTNYYRVNGEGNGVNNTGTYGGVAFRENGHRNVTYKLMSVGVR